MEQDFIRAVAVTIIAGSLIVGTGAALLFFVFRAVSQGRSAERRYVGLSIALTAFVFACCAVFFTLSFR